MAIGDTKYLTSLRPGQTLSADRVARIVEELQNSAGSGVPSATIFVPASDTDTTHAITELGRDRQGVEWMSALEQAGSRPLRSGSGVAAFRIGDVGLAILPPFPLNFARLSEGIDAQPLLSLLAARLTVGVALVRLGRYAVAIYEGRKLAVSKTDTRYVKGKHHAGGTSQRRFQRVRENQIHRLYVEASGVLERQWRPWLDRLDYVALGGEAATVNGFVKECPVLARLAPITLERRLDVREPNRASLDQVGAMLYECRVYPLRWDG